MITSLAYKLNNIKLVQGDFMASKLLNSGDLRNYQAIGEDGVLVYQRADAFVASVENSPLLGTKYAQMLAKPRFSEDGKKADWYIPFDSENEDYDVVSWNAASPEEKAKCYDILSEAQNKFYLFGKNLEARAITSTDKLYAHFLTGDKDAKTTNPAIHFPDDTCIYIVNGRPVITFWGFLNRGDSLKGAPLDKLTRPVIATAATAGAVGGAGAVGAGTAGAAAAVAGGHRCCKWLLWLLPLLLLLLLLLYLLWWYFFARGLPLFKVFPGFDLKPAFSIGAPIPDIKLKGVDVDLPKVGLQGDNTTVVRDPIGAVVPDNNIPDNNVHDALPEVPQSLDDNNQSAPDALDPNVPDQLDDNAPAPEPLDNEQPKAYDQGVPNTDDNQALDPNANNANDVQNNQAPNAVVQPSPVPDFDIPQGAAQSLTNDVLKQGDISKLNGTWKVQSGIVDVQTNRPLRLQYEFKDGKGTATITQKDGVKCTGGVTGGLNNGALQIGANSTAKCTNGDVYNLPKVVCTTGDDGQSNCSATYGDNTQSKQKQFQMLLHR